MIIADPTMPYDIPGPIAVAASEAKWTQICPIGDW